MVKLQENLNKKEEENLVRASEPEVDPLAQLFALKVNLVLPSKQDEMSIPGVVTGSLLLAVLAALDSELVVPEPGMSMLRAARTGSGQSPTRICLLIRRLFSALFALNSVPSWSQLFPSRFEGV